jgi:hypothetical protein
MEMRQVPVWVHFWILTAHICFAVHGGLLGDDKLHLDLRQFPPDLDQFHIHFGEWSQAIAGSAENSLLLRPLPVTV